MSSKKDWFIDWFDTKYYHILYQHRNETEAQVFMKNLTSFLQIPAGSSILDLACGKGRHSVFLNKLGYRVTGVDLSINSIKEASLSKNKTLDFLVQDMRLPFPFRKDAVFNLFTSFGYFAEDSEDIRVLENIKNCLNKNGVGVIDYLNVNKITANLVPEETVLLDGIEFHITRTIKNGFIIKKIEFTAEDGSYHHYFERVKCLNLEQFKGYLQKVGLKLRHCFGDYNLHPFDEENSNRLILIFE